ncbi:MAG: hypothetical protein ACE5I3_04395 [Phycisphaerae bacterium]
MFARRFLLRPVCLIGLATLWPGGCVITVDPIDGGNGGDNGDGTTEQITVRVVNATGHTLDPEIYVASEPVDLDHLFTRSRKFTQFGVGRLGLIAANDTDSFTIDCAQARMVGTLGGSFGGGSDRNDLTDPAGSGTQLVLTQDLVFYCGNRITFMYRRSGDGFLTTLDIDP